MAYSGNKLEQSSLAWIDGYFSTRLMRTAGEFRGATSIAACKKAIAVNPSNVEAHINMGFAHGKLNQSSQAVAAFKQAVAYYFMGQSCAAMGQCAAALAAYEECLRIQPTGGRSDLVRQAISAIGRHGDR